MSKRAKRAPEEPAAPAAEVSAQNRGGRPPSIRTVNRFRFHALADALDGPLLKKWKARMSEALSSWDHPECKWAAEKIGLIYGEVAVAKVKAVEAEPAEQLPLFGDLGPLVAAYREARDQDTDLARRRAMQ